MNAVGWTTAEDPEDLNRAFRIVSGSTSATGFEVREEEEFLLNSSSIFADDGVSLNRLEIIEIIEVKKKKLA